MILRDINFSIEIFAKKRTFVGRQKCIFVAKGNRIEVRVSKSTPEDPFNKLESIQLISYLMKYCYAI